MVTETTATTGPSRSQNLPLGISYSPTTPASDCQVPPVLGLTCLFDPAAILNYLQKPPSWPPCLQSALQLQSQCSSNVNWSLSFLRLNTLRPPRASYEVQTSSRPKSWPWPTVLALSPAILGHTELWVPRKAPLTLPWALAECQEHSSPRWFLLWHTLFIFQASIWGHFLQEASLDPYHLGACFSMQAFAHIYPSP